MKFLIIGDLHGTKPRIHFKDFDAIIAVGDFCSDKGFRKLKDDWVKEGRKVTFNQFIIKKIGKKKYNLLEKESIEQGRKILEFLNSIRKPVFLVPGNWDKSYGRTRIKDEEASRYNYVKSFLDYYKNGKLHSFLINGLENLYDCSYLLYKIGDVNVIGYGLSSRPENPKIDHSKKRFNKKEIVKLMRVYKSILKKLDDAYLTRDINKPTIFLSHNVPYNTKLDVLLNKGTKIYNQHFGSTIARDFILKYKPLICIGGHMHEHFGRDKIGKTVIVNAGFGADVNTLLEIEGKKIKRLEFYTKRTK